MSKSIANKILIIGWSSADWKVIDPMMKKGLLPNVSKLLETGSRAMLGTLDPPISTANWTTINTGKVPIKHGIYTFTEPGTDKNTPVTSKDRQTQFLWEILSKQGMKAHQIGAPASYPVMPVNGVSVADVFFENIEPAIEENLVYPSEKYQAFNEIKQQALTDAEKTLKDWSIASVQNNQRLHDELTAIIKNFLAHSFAAHQIAMNTLEHEEWNNLSVFFTKLSDIVHTFTSFSFPKNKDLPRQLHDAFKPVLHKCYALLDKMLGELVRKAGEQTIVMLVSQSGYLPYKSYIEKLHFNDSTYEYNTQGLLILKGRQAFQNEELYTVTGLDITPTVLAMLGHPIAKDMDGKVLLAAKFFERINKFTETYEPEASNGKAKTTVASISDKNYAKRLEQLGYITEDIAEKQAYFQARCKIASGLQSEVIPFLEKLHKKHPKNSWYGGRLAGSYLATTQLKEAQEMLDKVIRVGHEIPELHILRGNLYLMEMKFRSASKQYDIAEKNIKNMPNLYSQIAEGYSKIQQWQMAQERLEKEIKISPYPSAYMGLANTFMQRKMMAKAIEPLEKVTELAPMMPMGWFHLGNCKMQTKDYEGAAEAFEKAKKKNRDPRVSQQIQQALIVLYRDHLERKDKIKKCRRLTKNQLARRGQLR